MASQPITGHTCSDSASEVEQPAAPKLRIGVILSTQGATASARHVIEQVEQSEYAELTLIGYTDADCAPDVAWGRVNDRDDSLLFRACAWLDYQAFRDRTTKPNALEVGDLVLKNAKAVTLQLRADSHGEFDFEPLRNAHLDVLLDFTGTLAPEAHTLARFGMWSARPVAQIARSLFRRMCTGRSLMEVKLAMTYNSQSTETSWAHLALDHASLFRNYNRYYWSEAEALVHTLRQLHSGLPTTRALQVSHSVAANDSLDSELPGNWEIAASVLRSFVRTIQTGIERLLFRDDWFIAYRRAAPLLGPVASEEPTVIVRAPRGRFYADPFLTERDGKTFLFFEDFAYQNRKAVISLIEIDADGNASNPEPVLELDYHLSYPSIFEWRGEIYMLPESKENRTVEVFRALDFPRGWRRECVLMTGVSTVDSTMLAFRNKFWLFTSGMSTSEQLFAGDESLSLFYSDTPFGPWKAHPKNPIVTDVRNCRPAGSLFFESGQLLRPAQDCSERYGKLVRLNRVDVISEEDYAESPFATLNPDWLPGNLGSHNYAQSAGYQVVDGRTRIFRLVPHLFRRSVRFERVRISGPLFEAAQQRETNGIQLNDFAHKSLPDDAGKSSLLR